MLALVNGFILFSFSECLFWSVWRLDNSIPDMIVTWLAYSTLAYLFSSTVWFFRVNAFWAVNLADAVYGWLTEGGLIHTLYGTAGSAPFPISISITALSWHALISVLVGGYVTSHALSSIRPRWIAMISTGVGVFWGCWATLLWKETPQVMTPVCQYYAYAFGITTLLGGAWWLNFRAGCDESPTGMGRSGPRPLDLRHILRAVRPSSGIANFGHLVIFPVRRSGTIVATPSVTVAE